MAQKSSSSGTTVPHISVFIDYSGGNLMKTGALIVAAGVDPDKEHSCRQLDQMGSLTAAERIIATFRQCGINRIVVVTGNHAEELERLLSSYNIIFIRNASFEETEMLDSVKLGLAYLKDKVDQILFTPGDVSLFTCDTVKRLLQSSSPLTTPVYEGLTGHPILFSARLSDTILAFEGTEGLRGALASCGVKNQFIAVTDRGVIEEQEHDPDRHDRELLAIHNNDLVRPELSIELSREKAFFNEQVCTLLTLIKETENVREACSQMHISYTTAWNLIHRLEDELKCQLVIRVQGGPRGSHSELTPYGKKLVATYLQFTDEVRKKAADLFQDYFGTFFDI